VVQVIGLCDSPVDVAAIEAMAALLVPEQMLSVGHAAIRWTNRADFEVRDPGLCKSGGGCAGTGTSGCRKAQQQDIFFVANR
jgi:hypothetical protein